MGRWGNQRESLDAVMMETELGQLREVFDAFKELNNGKSIEDTFTESFHEDHNEMVIYQQLG